MPDDPPILEMIATASLTIRNLQPRLVVSHEELAVLPASRIFEVPCLFLTDFFQDPNPFFMSIIESASEIVFMAERGIFTEPPFLAERIRYVGPAIRRFDYGPADRDRARQELGIPPEAGVVLCAPGSYSEFQVPVAEPLFAAWEALPHPCKRLIWLAWRDYESLRSRFANRPDVLLMKEDWNIGRLIVASDLVITKGNRITVQEAASLGVPSISISAGVNWPDDVAIARVPSNVALRARDADPATLSELMAAKLSGGWPAGLEIPEWDGVEGAARAIAGHVERSRSRESSA